LHFTGRRFAVGDELTILIRPEVVSVKPCGPHPSEHPANVWKGVVKFRIFVGNFSEYVVDIRGTELRARVDSRFRFQVGDEVLVSVSPEDCLVFPAEDHGTSHRRMSGDKEDAG
ncbi:MAG: TOBE domain-containing protein, partial [Anaerolineae bacterium]|nr:TOBE domain-containing protein [Anaerolineae bacterium]